MIKIEYKGIEYKFNELTFDDYFTIEEAFKKPTRIVNERWWYEPSEFGMFFIKKACKNIHLTVEEKDWKILYPVFEHYFPTKEEYQVIITNIRFVNGKTEGAIEDRYFSKYLFLRYFGNITLKQINTIPLKEAKILYYYIIADTIVNRFPIRMLKEEENNMVT